MREALTILLTFLVGMALAYAMGWLLRFWSPWLGWSAFGLLTVWWGSTAWRYWRLRRTVRAAAIDAVIEMHEKQKGQ